VSKGVLARSCMAVFNSRPFTQPADLTGIKLQILRGRQKGEEKNKRDPFPKDKENNYPSREAISARKKHQMPTIYFKHTKALGIKK